MLAYLRRKLGAKPKKAAAAKDLAPIENPSELKAKNYLEDLALTRSMFDDGTLIMQQGDGSDAAFLEIMRKSRNSIQRQRSDDVCDYLEQHPDLVKSICFDEQDYEEPVELEAMSTVTVAQNEQASFSATIMSKLSGAKTGMMNVVFGQPKPHEFDCKPAQIINMRTRLNSDGFEEVTDADIEEYKNAASSLSPNIELTEVVEIQTNYIVSGHEGDWDKLYNEYMFSANQASWNLESEHPAIYEQIKDSVKKSSLQNGRSRQLAWSLLSGICDQNVSACYRDLYNGYLSDVYNLEKSTVDDFRIQKQISLDVQRTFARKQIGPFIEPIESRQNVLFNVLAAYAKHQPEIGYCQGMNFVCALILIGVDYDEVSAFVILEKLLGEYGQLSSLYDGKLTKLFSLSDHVYSWLLESEPELEQLIANHGVPLTTLFAGPLMAVFANIFEEPDFCLQIMDRLILQKELALVGIIKHVFKGMKQEVLARGQSDELNNSGLGQSEDLQVYLSRMIYIEAQERSLLFPPIN